MHSIEIEVVDGETSPYCSAIRTALLKTSPEFSTNHHEMVDVLTDILIGSRQHRVGPMPNPEVTVSIRDVIRETIKHGEPFKILVPMGPKKPVLGKGIDLAELSAVRMLMDLNNRISERYSPGAIFRYRIEDATGFFLEHDVPQDTFQETISLYMNGFENLIRIISPQNMTSFRESTNCDVSKFHEYASKYSEVFLQYLTDIGIDEITPQTKHLHTYKDLQNIGWVGEIPLEQRIHYYTLYSRRYPGQGLEHYQKMLARYFGITLARYHIRAVGNEDWGENTLSVHFAGPIPGSPFGTKRMYYRTLPLNQSKKHVPFWRTKGVVKINGSVTFSLLQDWDNENIIPCKAFLKNDGHTAEIDADYILV